MLKYKINKSGFMSDLDPLDVYSYEPYLDAVVNEDRAEMVYSVQCKCSTPHGMVAGDTVAVTVTRETAETAGETDRTHGFEETATVTSVSPDGLGFTFAALAVLFQPFIKIALGRFIWNIVDVIVAVGLVYLVVMAFKKKR